MSKTFVYAGTNDTCIPPMNPGNKEKGRGIHVFELKNDGTLVFVCHKDTISSSVIKVSKNKKYLYAGHEVKNFMEGLPGSGGGISSFIIKNDGSLSDINESIAYGSSTAYIDLNSNDKYLIAANHGSHSTVTCSYVKEKNGTWKLKRKYDDSTLALFHINDDGSIGNLSDLKKMTGHGYYIDGKGQSTSHLHSAKINNDGIIIACNRGTDCLEIFKLDEKNGLLTSKQSLHTHNGLAPRYLSFHQTLPYFYVVYENYPCLSVFSYTKTAEVKEIQILDSMNPEYMNEHPNVFPKGKVSLDVHSHKTFFSPMSPSDICVHPSGKYVFVANRAFTDENTGTITSFKIDENTGKLTYNGNCKLDDRNPRGFTISPDGRFLLTASMQWGHVCVYPIAENGMIGELICKQNVNAISSVTVMER